MLRQRSFWIILVLTAVAWLLYTMSETNEYPMRMRVKWSGFDTSRYVVVSCDTVLPVVVTSNCFEAIRVYRVLQRRPFVYTTPCNTTVKVSDALFNLVARQYGLPNDKVFSSSRETIHLRIVERQGRPFVPTLRDVDFEFADQHGLSGEPYILPDTVWIYGNPASLAQIKEVNTAPAKVSDISDSGFVTLALDPVWMHYSDLHASTDSIKVFLPVGHYVEETVSVPVRLSSSVDYKVQLYPPTVKVTLWVPPEVSDRIEPSSIQAQVSYDPAAQTLPVRITRFPANTRIRRVEPSSLQHVIIK